MPKFNLKRYTLIASALFLAAAAGIAVRFNVERAEEQPRSPESPIAAPLIQLRAPSKISHGYFINDRFSTAPFDWRPAGASIASVQQRWQCEPKWTFFSLENDRKLGNAAALWSKRSYPGDLTLRFFFGLKMDARRGNPFYYARDVNVTICSDGSDLRKGYTFCFGGFDNTCSCIMRDGVVIKQIPVKIPRSMDYLRHWFAFTVERIGGYVSFRVDHFFNAPNSRETLLEFEDPQPLAGDRVAIWTYNNTISIAKIQLSGESTGKSESPDFLPGPLATIYDQR